MQLPPIPKELRAGASLPGEPRSQSGLRVWNSLLSALTRSDLAGLSVLDIGCGDRLTHAIVELELPVGSYVVRCHGLKLPIPSHGSRRAGCSRLHQIIGALALLAGLEISRRGTAK